MKTSSNKKYTTNRQRIARVLAAIYILSSQTPLMIGLAAPQVYFRPTGGVSRLPLQVAAFNPPGFGDVEDAINLATGNVYVAMDGASRNNILQSGKDETTSNLNGNWNLNSRLRLGGFLRSYTTTGTTTPPASLFLGTGDGAGTTFQKVPSMTGLWGNVPSWIKRYQASTDLANTSFYTINKNPGDQYSSEWVVYRTRTGTVPTGSLTNSFTRPNRVVAPINKNFNAGNVSIANPPTMASTLDPDGQLDGLTAGTAYGWMNTNMYGGTSGTMKPKFVAALPAGASPMTLNLAIADASGNTYAGAGSTSTCQITSTPSTCIMPGWSKTVSTDAYLIISGITPGQTVYFGNFNSQKSGLFGSSNTIFLPSQVNTNLHLNAASANLNVAWTDFKVVANTLDVDGRLDGYTSYTGGGSIILPVNTTDGTRLNPSVVLAGPDNTPDTTVSIGLEDQTGLAYPNTAKTCTVSSAASICEIGDWTKPADGKQLFLAIRSIQLDKTVYVGGQQSKSFVTNGTMVGSGALAHYYDHSGTRYTFFNDNEYVDYQQNLHQQFRSAKYNADPEGEKTVCPPDATANQTCTPKTEFTYATGNAGRITKVKDQWGRVTTYDWAADGTLTNINYLLRNEADATTAARRATFTYGSTSETGAALPGLTVSKVVYTTGSGKRENTLTAGNTYATQNLQGSISRTFEFKYKLIGSTIAISRIIRPTEGQATSGQAEIKLETVYDYYPSVVATDTVGVAKAGRLKTVQQFQGTTKIVADMVYDLVPGLSNTYSGLTYTVTQGPAGATQKRTKYLFDDKSQLREKQVRDSSNVYDVKTAGATTVQDRDLVWKYDYFSAVNGTAKSNTFTLPNAIDINPATKNFNSGGATIASPATLQANGVDGDNALNGFVSSATGSYLNTKFNAVAGKTVSPTIYAQTTTGTALIYLGIQTLGGVGQVTEKTCTVTTTLAPCTMNDFPVPANSVDLQFAISIQAGATVYLGGHNSGTYTPGSSPDAPIGSTKSVTDPAGKRIDYLYDAYGNINNMKTYGLISANAEREEQWTYDLDNNPVTHTLKGQSGTRSGVTYAYGDVVDTNSYAFHSSISADNQSFRAANEISMDISPVGKAGSKIILDEQGRLTESQVQRNGTVRRKTTFVYKTGSTYGTYLSVPNTITPTETDRVIPTKQYSDWPETISTSNGGESRVFYYDAFGNRTVEIAANAFKTATTAGTIVDDKQTVIRSFNGFGQQVFNWVSSDQLGVVKVSQSNFAANGAIKDSWEGNINNLTQYSYDTNGRLKTVARGVGSNGSITTVRGKIEYTYDTNFGRVTSQVKDGVLTKNFEYDTLDQVIRASHKQSSDAGEEFVYEDSRYSVNGRKNFECVSGGRANLNPSNSENQKRCLTHTIDSLGRVMNTEDWTARTNTTFNISFDYDNFDRVIYQRNDALADINTSAEDRASFFVYDDHGNLSKQLGPVMRSVTYTASGLGGSTPITDVRRPLTQHRYTSFGLKYATGVLLKGLVTPTGLSTFDLVPMGACSSPSDIYADLNSAITCTNFDNLDRVTQQYDPDGYSTLFTYDALNNLTSQTRQVWKSVTEVGRSSNTDAGFASVTSSFAYDAVGRKLLTVDARGTRRGTTYDTLGNPLSEMTDTKLRSGVQNYTATQVTTKAYQYTSDGLLERVSEPKLSDGVDSTGWGLTFSGSTPPGGHVLTKIIEYGLANRAVKSKQCEAFKNDLPTLAGTGGRCTTYTYDALNRIRSTQIPAGSITMEFDIRGNAVTTTDADGFVTKTTYDARSQMRQETKQRRAGSIDMTAIPNDLVSTYDYDTMGNLKSKLERGLTTTYMYNSLGKAIGETKPSTASTIDKMYGYRLDGAKTAETIYGTRASAFATPDGLNITVNATTRPVPEVGTNGSGAILGYMLSPSGLKIGDYHTTPGPANQVSYVNQYKINGLGQWYLRSFAGLGSTYEQVFIVGTTNSTTADFNMGEAHQTYRKYNQNGQLISSFDEYTYSSNGITVKPKRNKFTYDYSPTGKQLNEQREVEVVAGSAADFSALPASAAYTQEAYSLASTQNAAGQNYSNAWYNERDQLEKASISDTNSNGAPAVQRDTVYTYFDDGSKSGVQVGSGTNDKKTFDYDARGRLTTTVDFNSGRTETNSYSGDGVTTQTLLVGTAESYKSISKSTIGGLKGYSSVYNTNGLGGCLVASCTQTTTMRFTANGFLDTATTVSAQPGKTDVSETATYLYDTYGQNTTYTTGLTARNTIYNSIGAIIEENATWNRPSFADNSQIPLSVAATVGLPNLLAGAANSAKNTYTVDSRGMRLTQGGNSGSGLIGRDKRYNADMQVSYFSLDRSTSGYSIDVANGTSKVPAYDADRLYFRYNPFGEQVLAVKAKITEHGRYFNPPPNGPATTTSAYIRLQTSTTVSVDGSVQSMILRTGNKGSYPVSNGTFGWYYTLTGTAGEFAPTVVDGENAVQDETFGLADGLFNSAPGFNILKPFSVITPPSGVDNAPLEAPTTALSTATKVDPTSIEAPDSNKPETPASSEITAPSSDQPAVTPNGQPATSSTPVFSSGTNLHANALSPTVNTPAFGVTAFTISPNAIPSTGNQNSSTSATRTDATPAFTAEFSLEAPVSVLPPAISSFSVTSIVNPLEDLGFIPGLGSVSDISAPGITAPGTVSTPSSGAAGITAPTDSSAGVPELPRVESPNGNVSSVIAPIGARAEGVKTLGFGYNIWGDCVENGRFGTCTPSSELEAERERQRQLAESAAGAAREAARLRLAELNAQLELRAKLGNDARADNLFRDLKNSPMVKGGLTNGGTFQHGLSTQDATDFWSGMASDLKSGQGLQVGDLDGLRWFAMNYVMQRDANNKPYYVQWDPVFGQTGSLVADLPGGSPVFLNGDVGQLNSRFGGRKWGAIGFVQSVFGGWDRGSYRAASNGAHGGPTVNFGAAGCRHPSMNKPSDSDKNRPKGTTVDLRTNIKIAENQGKFFDSISPTQPAIALANKAFWFLDKVDNYHPWDFKAWGGTNVQKYDDFGNFSFGATGSAVGLSDLILLQEAGRNEYKGKNDLGNTSVGLPAYSSVSSILNIQGTSAFGDDPVDYYWISAGIDYYRSGCAK